MYGDLNKRCRQTMRSPLTRPLSLLLALILTGGLCAACSKGASPDSMEDGLEPPPPVTAFDTTVPVHQTWVIPGDRPRGADAVWQAINTTLQAQWNTTVELRYAPWSTWDTQSATILAAENAPDALFVSGGRNYGALARGQLLMPVDMDLLTRHAPDIAEAILSWSDAGLRDCEIDGVAYMVPGAGNLNVSDLPVLIRGDLRQKYGVGDVQTLEELDAFLNGLAAIPEETVVPWNADVNSLAAYLRLAWFQPMGMETPFPDFPFLAYKVGETPAQIFNVMEEPAFLEALMRLHSLSVSGALPENAMYTRTPASLQWSAGQSACLISDLDTVSTAYAQTLREHPEWEPEWVLLNPEAKRIKDSLNRYGMALPVNSPEPERFLLVLNELFSNKELQDLGVAGLPGLHRVAETGNIYQPGESAKEYPYDQAGTWAWNNRTLMMSPGPGEWLGKAISDRWLAQPDRIMDNPLGAFVFDPKPVLAELSALNTVLGNDARFLLSGVSDTVSTDLESLLNAFDQAGIETVRSEMQRQVDEFLK